MSLRWSSCVADKPREEELKTAKLTDPHFAWRKSATKFLSVKTVSDNVVWQQGGLVMAKRGRLELGDNIYGYYRSIFNHCNVFGQQSNQIRWKRKIRAIAQFKVIQGHRDRYQSKACMRRTYLVPLLSYCSLLFIFWTLCVFEPPFGGGGLGATHDVHLGLIGNRVVNLTLVIIELFSLAVTAKALRAKIDRKSAISLQRRHFDTKFQVEGDVPHQ